MRIRQMWIGVPLALSAGYATAQQAIELPTVHASADAGCVEPARAGTAGGALSYACLNTMVAAPAPTAPAVPGTDPTKRATNTVGLYNASGLRNRMGPNLGISAQPYRPKPTYASPLLSR